MKLSAWLLLLFTFAAYGGNRFEAAGELEHTGMCDASAAVALSGALFVAASDEDNTLRLYDNGKPGAALAEFDLSPFLEVTGKSPEADLEAAARLGERVFWISSHGRNRKAKQRANRCRFFATEIQSTVPAGMSITPIGRPYKNLLLDLNAEPRLRKFRLDEADEKAPKDEDGLNIEGLAATPEGHLLICFRNPIPAGKALVVPLLNPNEVAEGSQRAKLGPPLELDLGGLGVRDIILRADAYWIIAGSHHDGGRFRFYRWKGGQSTPELLRADGMARYNPEALLFYPGEELLEFQALSDDGDRLIHGTAGKKIKDPVRRKFRSFWLKAQE